MRTSRLLAVLTALAAVLSAAPAYGDPEQTSPPPDRVRTIGGTSVSTAWTSPLGASLYTGVVPTYPLVRCAPGSHSCDRTLLHVTQRGRLTVQVWARSVARPDGYLLLMALSLHRSDPAGRSGPELPATYSGTVDEQVLQSRALAPGWYLVEVEWLQGVGDYTGAATVGDAVRDGGQA